MTRRVLSISLLWLCFASLPAHAGYLKCASERLNSADGKSVRKEIMQVAGKREVLWSSLGACVNSDRARIWIDLRDEPQSDGSLFRFNVFCDRGRASWSCRLSQSRRAHIEVELDGRMTLFKLGLPLGFDLQRAKNLVRRAGEVAPTMTVEHECNYSSGNSGGVRAAEWLKANQDAFRFSDPPITGSITEEAGSVSLVVEDEVLQFAPDPTDATKLEFRCWTFEVIVT